MTAPTETPMVYDNSNGDGEKPLHLTCSYCYGPSPQVDYMTICGAYRPVRRSGTPTGSCIPCHEARSCPRCGAVFA